MQLYNRNDDVLTFQLDYMVETISGYGRNAGGMREEHSGTHGVLIPAFPNTAVGASAAEAVGLQHHGNQLKALRFHSRLSAQLGCL